jgi:thiol-disulfide isomerase/thioredoxin
MIRFLACTLTALLSVPMILPLVQVQGGEKGDDKPLTIKGKLSPDDPKDKVVTRSPHKSYPYKMAKGSVYIIDMTSDDFDTYLRLENPAGKQVAFNDDVAPGNLNSRIVYKAAEAGEHKIIATSFDAKSGEFTLKVRKGTEEDVAKADPFYQLIDKKAPEITGEFAINGTAKKLSDLKGKVVLVDFWAVWCGPCIATFPHLRDWSKEFRKDGLEILGVTTYYEVLDFDKDAGKVKKADDKLKPAQEQEMIKAFAAHHKLTHQLLVLSKDEMETASKAYRVNGIPQAVLIDRKGNVRMVRVGSGPDNAKALEAEIRKLLAER